MRHEGLPDSAHVAAALHRQAHALARLHGPPPHQPHCRPGLCLWPAHPVRQAPLHSLSCQSPCMQLWCQEHFPSLELDMVSPELSLKTSERHVGRPCATVVAGACAACFRLFIAHRRMHTMLNFGMASAQENDGGAAAAVGPEQSAVYHERRGADPRGDHERLLWRVRGLRPQGIGVLLGIWPGRACLRCVPSPQLSAVTGSTAAVAAFLKSSFCATINLPICWRYAFRASSYLCFTLAQFGIACAKQQVACNAAAWCSPEAVVLLPENTGAACPPAGATTWGTNQLTVDRRLLEAAGRARPAAQPADARVLVRV